MNRGQIAIFLLAHFVVSLLLFIAILSAVIFSIRPWIRKYKPQDLAVFDRLKPLVSLQLTRFMEFITFFAKHQFLIPANLLIIFYFGWIRHLNWYSVSAASIAISSLLLMFLLKHLFHRKRPLIPLLNAAKGLSFPSGHAIMSVSFYGSLAWYVLHSGWPGWLQVTVTVLLIVFILLIGFSRVYLRVHYASDVIAGFLVGLIWLLISLAVLDSAQLMISGVN